MAVKEGKNKIPDSSGVFVKWFSELSNKDIAIAGGKGASLAEMYNAKFPIPPGFVVTAQAYSYFIEKSGLIEKIKEKLTGLDMEDTERLESAAKEVREIISNSEMPVEMENEISEAYDILDASKSLMETAKGTALAILKNSKEYPFVAVRSSATTEDLADASFAGQQESFLNVKGKTELIRKVKECIASLFTARAIYYREKKGFGQDKAQLAVVVMKMIDSDKSGVIFSRNPITLENTIMIEAVWGLGEGIVSGRIKPDNYIVDGDVSTFKLMDTKISEKKVAITRSSSGENQIVKLTGERAKQQVLNNYEIKMLAIYSKQLEEHYKKPQDIEFAIEGKDIYIVQSRPITTLGIEKKEAKEFGGEVLLNGLGASPGAASGTVKIVYNLDDLKKIKKGDVLVTEMTNPDMVVTMQRAAAIVTDEGGITSHAAIVSREMGIPAVVGTGEATKKLKDGDIVTVDGNYGKVFEGKGETKVSEVNPIVPTKTKIKVIVDLPDFAERAALSGSRFVGLTRIEGIIAESGKHPLYYVKKGNADEYRELLYKGIKKIAEPFEGVWVRTSDIRSDEFRNLEGAPKEVEGNPMLGDHGIRFSLKNPAVLKAEAEAIIKVAKEFPDKQMGMMMPQVISVSELHETKKIVSELGAPDNFKIGIMVETPAAVQIINDLCIEGIAFISFGTNDLTQYILAIDRNNSEVQYIYDEMNPAVLSAISYVIRRCRRYGVETSICGQAGSNPEMVKFLISEGIDSISTNADAAEKISKLVAEMESGGKPEKEELKQENPEPMPEPQAEQPVQQVESSGEQAQESPKFEYSEAPEPTPVPEPELSPAPEAPEPSPETAPEPETKEENAETVLQGTEKDEYMPGDDRRGKDIPSLNDAIMVDSSLFENKEEFNLEDELKFE
jgi:pyruvate,water dikinase